MSGPAFTARQLVLLATPPILLASSYAAFKGLAAWLGPARGYLGGFLFYWVIWCGLLPLWAVGGDGLRALFADVRPRFGQPAWLGVLFLLLPALAAYASTFPARLREASLTVVAASILFSLVNGTLEEVLWRGTYVAAFPDSWLWGVVYPSIGFGLWHLAPQAIVPSRMRGGAIAFSLLAILLGAPYGWVAK